MNRKLTKERLFEIRTSHEVAGGSTLADQFMTELIAHAEATIDRSPPKLFADAVPSRGFTAAQIMAGFAANPEFHDAVPAAVASDAIFWTDAFLAELAKKTP